MSIRTTADATKISGRFPVAPPAPYIMGVVDAKERSSKGELEAARRENRAAELNQIELEMVISEGEFAERVRVWHYLTFLPPDNPGHGMALHALHAFGFPYDGDIEVKAEDFIGRNVKVDLVVEEYKGKNQNKVADFYVEEAEEPQREAGDNTPKTAARPAAAPAPRAAAPAPAARAGMPWRRK